MTALGLGKREVYRLYEEEAFFADVECTERLDELETAPGSPRLRRIAGATTLIAAIGAAGTVTLLQGVVPGTGAGRSLGALALSRTSSTVPSRPWQQSIARRSADNSTPARRAAGARKLGGSPARVRRSPSRGASHLRAAVSAAARRGSARVDATTTPARTTVAAAVQPARAPVQAAAPAASPDSSATASPAPQGTGRSEFGFER